MYRSYNRTMQLTLHILVNPTVPTSEEYTADAFNQQAMLFSRLFTEKGHIVYFYGTSQTPVKSSTYYPILVESDYEVVTGHLNCGNYLTTHQLSSEVSSEKDRLITLYVTRRLEKMLDTAT